MNAKKKKRLVAKGWAVGDAAELLGLSEVEAVFVEIKARLATELADRRKRRCTQVAAAKLLGSSQSRVAKMEAGDASVSVDLLIRALLKLGATEAEVARTIAPPAGRASGGRA